MPAWLGAMFPMTVLLVSVPPLSVQMPPPSLAVLPVTLLLLSVSVALVLKMPPPSSPAVLSLTVLLLTVSLAGKWGSPPELTIPPPSRMTPATVVFPMTVLLLTVTVPPWLEMPPPKSPPWLSLTVLLLTVSLPEALKMPPASPLLPVTVLLLTVTVPPSFVMPPPPSSPASLDWRGTSRPSSYYLDEGDDSLLRPFEGVVVAGYELETDRDELERIARLGQLDDWRLYNRSQIGGSGTTRTPFGPSAGPVRSCRSARVAVVAAPPSSSEIRWSYL